MFDSVALDDRWKAGDGGLPDEPGPSWQIDPGFAASFEREFEREFADGFWDAPTDGGAPPPLPTMATCAPSGWSASELDTDTADPARLTDEAVIEAIVGFDRVSSWALARQAG